MPKSFSRKGINLVGFTRYGRRGSVPSSLQIRNELRALVADEYAREFCAELEGLPDSACWREIIAHRRLIAAAAAAGQTAQ
jgi:hypothetical protein